LRDTSITPGVSYVYSVTSLDKNGNESAPAAAPPAMVAK
jgi:hypothetical protein